jgi:prepilin-type processing-associated H-X9-DG protein
VIADRERTSPTRIDADREAGRLEIAWADGHVSAYDTTTVRWLCPCAFCRGEAGLPGWLDSRPTLTPDQTRLVDVRLVGQYALQPIWADGHATGYYTFALLRDRCPCDADKARRAASGEEAREPLISHRHEENG